MNWWSLKRKIHSSWLIAFFCSGVTVGIFLAQFKDNIVFSSAVVPIFSVIVIVVVLWRKYIYLLPFLVIGGLLLGLWRGSVLQIDLAQYKPLYGNIVNVAGLVLDDIDSGASGLFVVRLGDVTINGKNLPGKLWVTTSVGDIKRGDVLMLEGTLKTGFGNFAGVIYRANIKKIVQPQPGDIARVVRDWFADGVRVAIPEPESSLGVGYLVGQRRALPADLVVALQASGLTHVVVASGYNLTILVRLSRRLFTRVSKYLSALSSVLMVVSFVAITGMSPSMSRAGLVAGLSLAAWYYGRKFHPLVLLPVAAAVTVLINPSYAWGDLGWQLSFAAFAGVMIIAPLAQRYLFGDKKPGFIGQVLGETVSAQIATAPIIIMAFGQLSNVAIVTNLLVLPLVPLAMLLTFIAGIGGLIAPAIATIIGMPANWLLSYMVNVIDYFAALPWAISKLQINSWIVAICYAAIISMCIYMWRKTKYNLRDVNLVE